MTLRPVLWLFLAGLAPGIWQLQHPEGFGFDHGFEMAAIARHIADRGAYADPFDSFATGPTAVVPPLYPLFLAALIRIFRRPELIVLAAIAANTIANALVAGWMPRLSVVFYASELPGVFAGILWIPAARLMPQWDMSFTLAGMVFFALLTGSRLAPVGKFWRHGAVAGILAGALSLLNPAVVLVALLWVGFQAYARRTPLAGGLRYAAALVLTLGLCNLPWLLRNYRQFHAPVVRTNFGMTIYSSNNDCAQSSLFGNGRNGCYQGTHPVASEPEARLLASLGEVEYDRMRTADAWAWIRSHPARFRELTLRRVVEFWFPDPVVPSWPAYAIWGITVLSIPGFVLMSITMSVRKLPAVLFLSAVWLIYPLMYYVVVSSDRYRYPVLWTSLLPAGFLLSAAGAPFTKASAESGIAARYT